MSNISNYLSTNFDEHTEEKKPVSIKIAYTREIYYGSELKSRVELREHAEIPECPSNFYALNNTVPLLPVESNTVNSTEENKMSNVKKQEINTLEKNSKRKSSFNYWCVSILTVGLIAFFLGNNRLFIPNIFLTNPITLDKIETELYANILDQNSSIKTVIENLRNLNRSSNRTILTSLFGPTGVGKTHLVNLLGKLIDSNTVAIFHSSNLPELTNKRNSLSINLRIKLYFSKYFIIIIDDLKYEDLDLLKVFTDMTYAIEDTNILILTIFNTKTQDCLGDSTEEIHQTDSIKEKLSLLSKEFHFNHFNFLNESTVKRWLKKEITKQNVKLTDHNRIIDNLLKTHNIKCHGLKGLHSKLLVMDF